MEKLKARKKNSEMTEDNLKQAEKQTQELTDRYCKKADQAFEEKKKEIMEI
jgi:ribosome recycling factor